VGRRTNAVLAARATLQRLWSETTWQIQTLRDNPECAQQEHDRILDGGDSGIVPRAHLRSRRDVAAPFIASGARRAWRSCREQGFNSEIETGAAFDRAGFESYDVHMSDVISGRVSLAGFKGFVACGGFSYGTSWGRGGLGQVHPLQCPCPRRVRGLLRAEDTFALGLCNGCQMMSNLHELIPGAEDWPKFVKNSSEQFEARLVLVEVPESPSILMRAWRAAASPSSPPTARAGPSSPTRAPPSGPTSACATWTAMGIRPRPIP